MIDPAPTTDIDPRLARGLLLERGSEVAGKPDHIVFGTHNNNYQLHLQPTEPVDTEVGKRLIGTVRVDARKIDRVHTGGRFIEPVYGRPRRVQGTVVAITDETVVVDAGIKIHLRPTERDQKPSGFKLGELVGCDVHAGATFTPAS
ncbi:MAG: hypothetical protein JJU33_09070 [Phycisphaerales bacterium]|nr:hypothetical protein [Phycisphaerales bacterium]